MAVSPLFEFDKIIILTGNDAFGATDKGKTFSIETLMKHKTFSLHVTYEAFTYSDEYQADYGYRNDRLRLSMTNTFLGFTYGLGYGEVNDFGANNIQNAWHKTGNTKFTIPYEEVTYKEMFGVAQYYHTGKYHWIHGSALLGHGYEYDCSIGYVYRNEYLKTWIGIGYEWYEDTKSESINYGNEYHKGAKVVVGIQSEHPFVFNLNIHESKIWGTLGVCW